MASYAEKTKNDIISIVNSLQRFAIHGYSQADIRDSINQAAARIELFLKKDVYPLKSNNDNFFSFIDELKNDVSGHSLVDKIHDLRKLYNKAKHDPLYKVELSEAIEAVKNIIPSIDEISLAKIGQSASPIRAAAERIFWICGWDHIIHAEVEVAIFLPSDYDGYLGAHSIDMVNLKFSGWDALKSELPSFGKLLPYQDWIPKGQYEFWFSESDCLNPLVFEGDYKSLLICLAKHESKKDGRLPGLNRTDSSQNLFQSCVLAALDCVQNSVEPDISEVVSVAISQYAVPVEDTSRVESFVTNIIDLTMQVPTECRAALSGPFWVTEKELEERDKYAIDKTIHSAIDKENRFLLGVKML